MSTTPKPLPDSGARSEFSTGAVRDASIGKGLPSRIPPAALRGLARRFEDGAAKYADVDGVPNWQLGVPLSRYYDSAFRHLLAAAEGDTTEEHLSAVLWNISCWIWTEDAIAAGRLPASLDDLPFARAATEDLEHEHDPGFTLPDQTGGTEWWDPKHDTAKIRFSDGREFDAPPLPEGYDSYRALPYTHGPKVNDMGYFWYPDGDACCGWAVWAEYGEGPDQSKFYWIIAERTVKPGDRVRVIDADGFGEPYEYEATVQLIKGDQVWTNISAVPFRRDQVTALP
jgi:hypothetical protein